MTIRKLDPAVAALIAAGEVVERPVSVVKECVENSLDAGATKISVELLDGGKSMISVCDNGCGIPKDQLTLAVEKHATSKITKLQDLESLMSLGYRGEALASMASVGELEVYSRPADEEGAKLQFDGAVAVVQPLSLPQGTRVTLHRLFSSLPARLKFLKSPAAETRRISELLKDYSVSRPDVEFRLISDGKVLFSSVGNGRREDALKKLWGDDVAPLCRERQDACGGAQVWWQDCGVGSRFSLTLFINGRRVNDKGLRAAITSHPWAGRGNWYVDLALPSGDLDVNIHPAKTEILLRRSQEVFGLLRATVGDFSAEQTPLSLRREKYGSFRNDVDLFEPLASPFASNRTDDHQWPSVGDGGFSSPSLSSEGVSSLAFPKSELKVTPTALPPFQELKSKPMAAYMGQMSQGYLIFFDDQGLILIDPHAAHERVQFEKLYQCWKNHWSVQQLVAPLPLPPSLIDDAREFEDRLEQLGLKVVDGMLTQVPATPFEISGLALLRGALAALREGSDQNELLLDRFASKACKASVKLTDQLTASDAVALYDQLMECQQPRACPHGRPAMLRLTNLDLDNHFGRNGL